MPTNLKELRSRIKSVKSTQKITKAMQLVSAAKFGRSQSAIVNARPYAQGLENLVQYLAYFVRGGCALPLLVPSTSKTALVVVVSSDRGLCGGYNANIIKMANKTWDALEAEGYNVSFTCIGKKAFHPIMRRKHLKTKTHPTYTAVGEELYAINPASLLGEDGLTLITTSFAKHLDQSIEPLADALAKLYAQQKIGKLVIIYSKFHSAMVQTPVTNTVLPLPFISDTNIETGKSKPHTVESDKFDSGEPIFEPERDDLLSMALPRYMSSQILHMILEAQASEYGARMTAMENATRNAKEIERKLQITYQRARQAAITNELIEIISGAEAL